MKTERADILLFRKGLTKSREDAKKLIMAGKVRTGPDAVVAKPSDEYPENTAFSIIDDAKYVSRGAYKLLPAIQAFPPLKKSFIACDIGASTGGFCDVLLQAGALRVYAVDSGYGQLHSKIRNRPEIISLEKTNARYLSKNQIPEDLDAATIDVSFISVLKILPAVSKLLAKNAMIYVLVKPQFEARRRQVKKGGVVKDPELIRECVSKVANFAESKLKWKHIAAIPSPILGPKGNREQMLVFQWVHIQ